LQREDTKESIRATSKAPEIIALEIFTKNDWRNNSRLCIWFSLNLVNFYLAKFWNSIHCGINSIKKKTPRIQISRSPPTDVWPISVIDSNSLSHPDSVRRLRACGYSHTGGSHDSRAFPPELAPEHDCANKRQWREHVAF
jgi:hypothetical protein